MSSKGALSVSGQQMLQRILLIGSGGREHAMGWKLALSPRCARLCVAPGNDGMPSDWERWSADLGQGQGEFERLAARARQEGITLCVVGPDNPLADGIVDVFEGHGIACFGPRAGAARIEASKAFAKEIMLAAGVPTARAFTARSRAEARQVLQEPELCWSAGYVVKFDGLAFGKGVQVCPSEGQGQKAALEQALQAVDAMPEGAFVIEELLTGEELSWMAFCDGERASLLEPARDHKRLRDGDRGPNTGGMGAFSPVPGVPASWSERMHREVFAPVLAEMKKRGVRFQGLLYAGIMADFARDRFWVLEFNARFGDPETQVLLPRMSDDFVDWCAAVAHGDISNLPRKVGFRTEAAVCVVAAAKGYPDAPEKGAPLEISALPSDRSSETGGAVPAVFFAGVKKGPSGELAVSGGRVLASVGMAPKLFQARDEAYRTLESVRFAGMQVRRDIAKGIGSPS